MIESNTNDTLMTATSIVSSPRSPFKQRKRLEIVPEGDDFLVTTSEWSLLRANGAGLFLFGVVAFSTEVQEIICEYIPLVDRSSFQLAGFLLMAVCTGNIFVVLWHVLSRILSRSPTPAPATTTLETTTESPLRAPRSIARNRAMIGSPLKVHSTPQTVASLTPGRHAAVQGTFQTTPKVSSVSSTPAFYSVYGTSIPPDSRPSPAYQSPLSRTPLTLAAQGKKPFSDLCGGSFPSSPLPNTGSPRINRIASERLSGWTDQLREKLLVKVASKSPIGEDDAVMVDQSGGEKANVRLSKEMSSKELSRKALAPEASLKEMNLSCYLEEYTENLRRWFSKKIIGPLNDDIIAVTKAFSDNGLDHLSPSCPASFSLFVKNAATSSSASNGTFILSTQSFAIASKPQTLLELCQKSPSDPMVQKRLRLERYLSFSSLSSHRAVVIRRISELAEDGLVGALRWTLSILQGGLGGLSQHEESSYEDAFILMHLFCAFMDEHLPSEEYYEGQPFSSKHFVAFEEKPSSRSDAIQIQQVHRQPPYFRLIAEDRIYEVYPGAHNVFHVIILMVEYLHRRYNGYLGVGNLASPAIDLVSILNMAFH